MGPDHLRQTTGDAIGDGLGDATRCWPYLDAQQAVAPYHGAGAEPVTRLGGT